VECVRSDVPDNPLGISNFSENWGNHIIIRLDQGGWAMVAHLQQGSVAVAPGTRVSFGSFLGTVGNSGRSPSPHLHLQAQQSGEPGAPTRRFRLANYLTELSPSEGFLRWHATGVPQGGTVLAPALPSPAVHALLAGMAPGRAVWSVESMGRIPPSFAMGGITSLRIEVGVDEAGRHLHTCRFGGGKMVSRLDPDAWRPIDLAHGGTPFLRLIALALPAVPYAATPGMVWEDVALLAPAWSEGRLGLSMLPFRLNAFVDVRCQCRSTPGHAEQERLCIVTEASRRDGGLPERIVTEFDATRGPVLVSASFETGSLIFSMVSFEPMRPLQLA
jgi:hypothetical protein